MNILLTGASGWLGRTLAPRLRRAGHTVTGLDVAPGAHTNITGSVTDKPLLQRTFRQHQIEAVIHAAALHKPDIARVPPQNFVDVNITGTLNLLQLAVEAGNDRFVFTSTTSLMISAAIRHENVTAAHWIDETLAPIEPRNIYGVTKHAAENLCRLHHMEHGLACIILRTARFFPEDDDTHRDLPGPNLKANEFLHRRLTVEDAAEAHLAALDRAPDLGCETFVISAPTPFTRADAPLLMRDAPGVITRLFPEAAALYAQKGWRLPARIGRVYDAAKSERRLGFRCTTDFAAILGALRTGRPLPFTHDPGYISPVTTA